MLAGSDTFHTAGIDEPRVPRIRVSDGPAGVRGTSWVGPVSASFPCGSALGASFDPALVDEVGRALGREAKTKSAHLLLGPTINLQRTPIGGRNFECFSEDPYLTSVLAVAYVKGLQHERVAACVKHLVANDCEFERMTISAQVDEATLREVYLAPFEAVVVEAGARAVMTAYNKLDGTWCSEHRWLLTDVLRNEWGFEGVVMSDWFGTHSAGPSLLAGLDLEMPGPPRQRGAKLAADLECGAVSEDDLDRSVARMLALADWTGADDEQTAEVAGTDDETRSVIRRAAAAGTVLLRNTDAALPFDHAVKRVALIGPGARFGRVQGGGSARVSAAPGLGPFDALSERGFDVHFEPGGDIARYVPPAEGEFTIEFRDDAGHRSTESAARLSWYWDEPPAPGFEGPAFGVHITGGIVPDASGPWEVGAHSVGPVTVRLDGDTVVDIPAGQIGGAYFGLGSHETRAVVHLEAGRHHRLDVEYPQVPDAMVRGLAVGVRPLPAADLMERAVASAREADVAVVIVGTDDEWETEGEDRTFLGLPGRQDELVAAVAAANPHTVVVLNSGSPMTMPWLNDVAAVLQLWFPGQEIGEALVDVLTGAVEPGGRLPLTFPRHLDHTPVAEWYPGREGTAVYGEGPLIGHRWYDRNDVEPLFPFGFGLGYTSFTIDSVAVTGGPSVGVSLTLDIANTGERDGSEVAQVYVEPVDGDESRPVRTLAAFRKVAVAAGATERIVVEVPVRGFSRWTDDGWTVPIGDWQICVGRSSRDHAVVATVGLEPTGTD